MCVGFGVSQLMQVAPGLLSNLLWCATAANSAAPLEFSRSPLAAWNHGAGVCAALWRLLACLQATPIVKVGA